MTERVEYGATSLIGGPKDPGRERTTVDVGQVLDNRYEIVAVLGRGGMSETYRAIDRETGQTVVVKLPFLSMIGDPGVFGRYQREMEIGRRLRHPHIQRVLTEGESAGRTVPYMVLEYIEGEALRKYLAVRGPLPEADAVRLTLQLADALQYCHDSGIVHRDLKPENVLITPDGQAKIVDFGIALLRGARRLTFGRFTSEVGTPDYMAPEQVRGERGDARTDIYALGTMLFEMLAGEVPFQGDNPLTVMSQRLLTEAPRLRGMRPDVSPALEAVAYRALRREPAERYQSMADLRHDLEHLDEVEIPDYAAGQLAARPRGPLPPALVTIAIIVAVFVVLILIGVLAQLAHQGG